MGLLLFCFYLDEGGCFDLVEGRSFYLDEGLEEGLLLLFELDASEGDVVVVAVEFKADEVAFQTMASDSSSS